jgi:hypothetical protein
MASTRAEADCLRVLRPARWLCPALDPALLLAEVPTGGISPAPGGMPVSALVSIVFADTVLTRRATWAARCFALFRYTA